MRLADDDAEPLGPGLQLLDAGGTLPKQRGQCGTLLAKDFHSSGCTICSGWQLRDGCADCRELLLWRQRPQFRHRKIDATQRLVESVSWVCLADVHGKALHGRAKLLGIHAGQLRCQRVALQCLNLYARACGQIAKSVNASVDARHQRRDLRSHPSEYGTKSLQPVDDEPADFYFCENAYVLVEPVNVVVGLSRLFGNSAQILLCLCGGAVELLLRKPALTQVLIELLHLLIIVFLRR